MINWLRRWGWAFGRGDGEINVSVGIGVREAIRERRELDRITVTGVKFNR